MIIDKNFRFDQSFNMALYLLVSALLYNSLFFSS